MDVGPVGTGESKVNENVIFKRGKHVISVVGSNKLSFYTNIFQVDIV